MQAIPWENFDVLLGRPVTRDPRDAFAKIVGRGRGGWCYEMNGLFDWMLEALGFSLTRLAAAVMREQMGDGAIGNHLMALVSLDGRRYVADVGLGGGLVEPVPLEAGRHTQRFLTFTLEPIEGGWWRFRNHPGVPPPSFDFHPEVVEEALLEERCRWLQRDPASPLTRSAVVQRHREDALELLVRPTAVTVQAGEPRRRRTADGAAYVRDLSERFGLTLPEAEALWPRISAAETPFD